LVPDSSIVQNAWTRMIGKSIKNRDGVHIEITREDLENAILINQVDFFPDSLGNVIYKICDNHFFYYILDKKASYLIYWNNKYPDNPTINYGTRLEVHNLVDMIDVLDFSYKKSGSAPPGYAYFLTYFFPGNLSVTPVLVSLSYNKDKTMDFLFIKQPRLMAFHSIDEYIEFCFASWKNYIEIYPKRVEYDNRGLHLKGWDPLKKRVWNWGG